MSYRWILWLFIIIYCILLSVYCGVYILNNSPIYTYFKNPGAPGASLSSTRTNFDAVTVRMTVFGNILAIAFIMLMNARDFRDIYALNVAFFVLYCISIFFVFMGLIGLGNDYANCNGQNQYGNLCNDWQYCCPLEILSNPANGCPNTVPCPGGPLLEQLGPNPDFLGLFWINFVLLLLQIGYAGFVGWLLFRENHFQGSESSESDSKEESTEKPPLEPQKEPVVLQKTIGMYLPQTRAKPHGLRQRK
jgi:hypothetical protein